MSFSNAALTTSQSWLMILTLGASRFPERSESITSCCKPFPLWVLSWSNGLRLRLYHGPCLWSVLIAKYSCYSWFSTHSSSSILQMQAFSSVRRLLEHKHSSEWVMLPSAINLAFGGNRILSGSWAYRKYENFSQSSENWKWSPK